MNLKVILSFAAILTASCGDVPKDPGGTLDRVRAERQYKVGLVSSDEARGRDSQQALLDRVSAATGARPIIQQGASEPLLAKLEEGHLDLVIGEFSPKSPWRKHVSFLPPLAEAVGPDSHVVVAAAAMNGENSWIALLHRESRAVPAGVRP